MGVMCHCQIWDSELEASRLQHGLARDAACNLLKPLQPVATEYMQNSHPHKNHTGATE